MTPVLGPSVYHGEVEAFLDLPGMSVAVTRRPKGTAVAPHSHSRHSFIALLGGSHCWSGDDGAIHWSIPSLWYFRPALCVHSHAKCPTDIRSVGFHFEPGVFDDRELPNHQLEFDSPAGRSFAEIVCFALLHPGPSSRPWIEGAFHSLLGYFIQVSRDGRRSMAPAWLESARIQLDRAFQEEIALARLARAVSVHPSHLAREFRRHFGLSVGEYIRDRRLEWSHREIRHTCRKIAEIATAAGFADHAHFCRVFKSRYGQTPSQLRVRLG